MLVRRIALVILAIALGLVLQSLLRRHLAALQVRAVDDAVGARTQLAGELRVGGLALFGLTALLGASLAVTAFHGRRLGRFPPSGSRMWSGTRTLTGVAARRAALAGMVLGTTLLLCSLAGAAITLEMVTRLLACRAP